MNILYVEDNPLDADLTRNTLHRLAPGLHLDVATSLHGALEHLQSASDRYDLILADVRLPDGDGLELLAIVRQRGLSLPFVIVTGSGNEELVFRALKAGADDYIVKRGDYLAHLPHVLSDIVRRYRNRLLRHTRPLRVLYAEHRATDIDLTSRFLARYAPHIRLQIARNAEGVLRRLPPETSVLPCDVLLLDYRLPGLNALEILKEVRQVRRLDIPVVLVTGQGSEEIALQAFKLGASDYITKTDNYLYRLPIVLEKVFYHAQLQRQQTALRQSEARYRDLFEEAADGIFIASPEGQYLDVNARGCAMLGYTREEILRKRIADLVPLEDQQVAPLRLDELRAGKTVFSERRMKHKDGHLVHVEISAKKLPDGNLQAIVRDISERKRLEASIQRQRRFEQLVMHLSAHFINLPPEETDAAITRALKLIGEFAGVERSYVFLLDDGGKTASNTHEWCAEGVPPRKDRLQNLPLERLPWWAEKLRRQETIYIPRLEAMSPEAAAGWEHFREQNIQSLLVVPMVSRQQVIGFTGFASSRQVNLWAEEAIAMLRLIADIFVHALERRDADRHRRQLEAQLRQSQKLEAIGRLAGGIAHDFNNILTIITGYTDLLLRRMEADHPIRPKLQEIGSAAKRAANLTGQLLAFSRKQVLQPKILNLNEVVNGMSKMVRRLVPENIELVFDLQEDLPPIYADPGQLEQVILNLVVNAGDAMPDGGRLTICTKPVTLTPDQCPPNQREGRYVTLTVADTGIGMDEETMSHIFEPFFTTKEEGRGTGLGLATVYGIVTQSGGFIVPESEPGRGTAFTLYFPPSEAEPSPPAAAPSAQTTLHGEETILVLEDEPELRDLMREILTAEGYTVLLAGNGQEALSLCAERNGPIHLLLTDVVIPGGMSGRQVAETLLKHHPDLRVLYISGYTDELLGHHNILSDGTVFLPKPFSPTQLLRQVRRVLDA